MIARVIAPKDPDVPSIGGQSSSHSIDAIDDPVALLRERVLSLEDDPRDLIATLLSENRFLVAARLLVSLHDLNIPEDQVRHAEANAKNFCRAQLSGTTATDDPLHFADLVEALAVLEPGNVSLAKSVERACTLLLNHARRSLAKGDLPEALALARRAAAADSLSQVNRIRCAELLGNCGRPDEGAAVLLDSPKYDEALLGKVGALFRRVDDWSILHMRLEKLRSSGFSEILADVKDHVSVQLNDSLDKSDVLQLLNGALALVAAGGKPVTDPQLVAAVLKRSRRAIRRLGRGSRPLLEELCKKHLTLCPQDRDVRRLYIQLLMACGRHVEAREKLLLQLQRDPHDEGMWRDLSKCCAILGLGNESSDAENQALSMTASGSFDVAEFPT